jgi:hypothetical protein
MKKWLTNISLSLVSACVSLVVAEYIVREYAPEVSDTFIVELKKIDDKYHHGSLDSAKSPPPNSSAYRIMFIGDSFTHGICDRAVTFPALVEKYFKQGGVDGVPKINAQGLNLGVPSFSPSIYGAVLRDFAPVFNPHLVVLAVDDSDPQDDYLYRNFLEVDSRGLPISVYPIMPGVPPLVRGLARKSKLVRSYFAYVSSGDINKADRRPGYDAYLERWDSRLAHYLSGTEEQAKWKGAFSRSLNLVEAFINYCKEHNIKVVLVNYPYPPGATKDYGRQWRRQFRMDPDTIYTTPFHDLQRDLAESRAVPYYDFTKYLRNFGNLSNFYNDADGHFSGVGNDHLARELVRFINTSVLSSYQHEATKASH